MIPKTETSGDDAAEEWSTSVNWEEDPGIKTERRRRILSTMNFIMNRTFINELKDLLQLNGGKKKSVYCAV